MKRIYAFFAGILLFPLLLAGCDETTLEVDDNNGQTGAFTVFRTEHGLADNAVNDMALDFARRGVWFATGNGVSFYSNADSTIYSWGSASGLPELKTNAIAYDPLGTVWSGSEAGIAMFDSLWTFQSDMGEHSSSFVTDIEIHGADLSVWFATQSGIAVKGLSGWTSYVAELGVSSYVTALASAGGKIWAGSTNGVVAYDIATGTWASYGVGFLPSTMVNAVFSGSGTTVWVGTASVAASFDGSTWKTYGQADGLDTFGINDFDADNFGTVWAATDGGVYTFMNGRWANFSLPSEVTGSPVRSVLYDSINDAFWFGTLNGVVRYDATTGS